MCVCVCVCLCVNPDYCEEPTAGVAVLQVQCELSNDKKLAAKRVSELSSELFFSVFVRVTVTYSFLVQTNSQIVIHNTPSQLRSCHTQRT